MTRKRFIKLLMAYGYQRRDAEAMALCARAQYGEYHAAWHLRYVRTARYHQAFTTIRRAAKQATKVFSAAVERCIRRFGGSSNV